MSGRAESLNDSRLAAAGRRRSIVVAVGLVAAVALVAAAVGLLSGEREGHVADTALAAVDDPDATEGDAGVDGLEDLPDADEEFLPDTLTVTYEIYLARDPFDPVVPEEEPEPAPTDPDDPDAPDPDDPDAPAPDPDDPDAPAPDERCEGEEEVVCNGHVVSLLEIDEVDGEQVATIQVDTTVYDVRTGERFAAHFNLLRIEGDRATIQFGDEIFHARLGDHVLK